ncbi:hypothetical protein Tco_0907168 [Tanacetum coccineum]|uniref:Uncharacterized protein n=1 Tax=Tanacetum coccineum TaxID=301880 RepID=A0ABQ5CLU3_9ASTR
MTGNKEKLDDFGANKGGIVKFGGGDGRISGKGTIRTSKLDFENVYYVEELQHFNLFSVSQICDKKNKVLFTDTDCLVLSEEFQLPDARQVVLRIPREHDLYTFHISDLQPEQKLAKEGLVDGLPLKVFTNEHNCVACNKGKQHKASYKHISAVRLITESLQLLHMDLFGPTNIRSIDQKYYSLVVTDDFSSPSSSNGPMLMGTQCRLCRRLAKLQRQEYEEPKDAAGTLWLFDPAGGVLLVVTSADRDPAGGHPADQAIQAASTSDQIISGIFTSSSYDDDFRATLTNLAPAVEVNPVPTKRVNTIHPQSQILGDLASPRDARGIIVRNKARLVAQGHRQEEGIDYDEALKNPYFPKHVYMRGKALYGLHQAPRAGMQDCLLFCYNTITEEVKQLPDGIFPHSKNNMLQTSLQIRHGILLGPDIKITPLTSQLNWSRKFFKYLKGQPKLGLWYPKDSPFQLEAYSDSDYAGSHELFDAAVASLVSSQLVIDAAATCSCCTSILLLREDLSKKLGINELTAMKSFLADSTSSNPAESSFLLQFT